MSVQELLFFNLLVREMILLVLSLNLVISASQLFSNCFFSNSFGNCFVFFLSNDNFSYLCADPNKFAPVFLQKELHFFKKRVLQFPQEFVPEQAPKIVHSVLHEHEEIET